MDALRRLASSLDPLAPQGSTGERVPVTIIQSSELARFARLIFRSRASRTRHFKQSMFGEPAWDMLLALYATADSTRLSIGELCSHSGSPATTGLRWLDYLEREELVVRRDNPRDARSGIIELTEKGTSALEEYLSETLVLLR